MLVWASCYSQILRNEYYHIKLDIERKTLFYLDQKGLTGKYLFLFHYVVNTDWFDHLQQCHYFELCLQENIHILRKNILKEDKIWDKEYTEETFI